MPRNEIDEVDRKIIDMLQEDARIPLAAIAATLGVSTPTISDRVSKLRRHRVILGFRTEVDWSRLGYDLLCVTTVLTAFGKGRTIIAGKRLARIKGVIAVYFVMGDLDFMVVFRASDKNDIARITNELMSIPGIVRTNTHVVLKTVKEEFFGPIR